MKRQRKYLSDLLKIDIHHVVNSVGYWDMQIGNYHLSLQPESFGKREFLQLFINNQRVHKQWDLYARPHVGELRNGARIPVDNEVWYVEDAGGRRYRHLFIDVETCRIGTRRDFYPDHNAAYPRGKDKEATKTFKEQCRAMEKELFKEDEWEAFHRKTVLKSRFGH